MKPVIFYIFILLFFYWSHKEIIQWHLAQIPNVPKLEVENIIEIISPGCRRMEEEEKGIVNPATRVSEMIMSHNMHPFAIPHNMHPFTIPFGIPSGKVIIIINKSPLYI